MSDPADVECANAREVLSAHLDGEAAAAEQVLLAEHLAGCPDCRALEDDFHLLQRQMRLRPAEAAPDLLVRVLAVTPVGRSRRWLPVAAVAGTAVVTLGLAAATVDHRAPNPHTAASVVVASDAYLSAAPAGGDASLVLTLRNAAGADDALLGVSTDAARETLLHATSGDGSGAGMRTVDLFLLGPGQVRRLAPNRSHIMLEAVSSALRPGMAVQVALRFDRAPPITLTARVLSDDELLLLTSA